jgi:hypothetical protein
LNKELEKLCRNKAASTTPEPTIQSSVCLTRASVMTRPAESMLKWRGYKRWADKTQGDNTPQGTELLDKKSARNALSIDGGWTGEALQSRAEVGLDLSVRALCPCLFFAQTRRQSGELELDWVL